VEVDAGSNHSVALRSDGSVVAWGENGRGQCDVPAPPLGAIWLEVKAGGSRTVARYGPDCPAPVVYCTAKVSSLGCTPSISLSAPPSASSGSGSLTIVTELVGNELGLLLHSTQGARALPLHGGWLCLRSPLLRHAAQALGGSPGTCSGVLSEDLNAYIASGADPALVAGAGVWLQAWSRDRADPSGDHLSDALAATVCP
jgi:hypothetical protein